MFSFIVTVSHIHHVLRLNLKCDEKLATVFGAFRAQTHTHTITIVIRMNFVKFGIHI